MAKRNISRQTERTAAMKLIYEWEMGGDGGADSMNMVFELEGVAVPAPAEDALAEVETIESAFVERMVQGVIDRIEDVDDIINQQSVGWKTDRMPKVDLAILRLGVYELSLKEEPVPVIINEAVELANTYCGDKSGAFINGVLGSISRKAQQQ